MLYDVAYYGMKDLDAKLEVESEYIRDKDTARKLQRRLLMWYANQHLTMKLDLPASYIHLEAGDYIRFDELIGGKLAFGFDYTQQFVKNGQLIYPVFFVTKVAKSLSKVSLELVQVHRGDFGMNDDDLNNYEIPNPYDNNIYEDIQYEENQYFNGSWYNNNGALDTGVITAITNTNFETGIEIDKLRIWNSIGSEVVFNNGDSEITIPLGLQDTNAFDLVNATISETDSEYGDNVQITPKMFADNVEFEGNSVTLIYELEVKSSTSDDYYGLYFTQTITKPDIVLGDVNGDGGINIQDIVQTIQIALGNEEYKIEADLNEDTIVNVQDIVILIGLILGN